MDKIISDILNNINEGLVLIDQRLNICIWNKYMEYLTGINAENAIDNNIYEILPNLTRKYLKSSISNVMDNGLKMFFSSSMHGKLVNDRENLNLKISRFDYNNSKVLVLEFLDVTSQFIQVDRLKKICNQVM
ncbi:PAS domain-containing protein [Clostridium tyrobutyricum]|uniref:PAS domain-containing protein n=1 Tax=Clostridium tyrobutyricum TaxID=1519 RepID=UPI0020CCD4D9|nr:PAS domain-containing protein [Clostridium tyrobutyricum]